MSNEHIHPDNLMDIAPEDLHLYTTTCNSSWLAKYVRHQVAKEQRATTEVTVAAMQETVEQILDYIADSPKSRAIMKAQVLQHHRIHNSTADFLDSVEVTAHTKLTQLHYVLTDHQWTQQQ